MTVTFGVGVSVIVGVAEGTGVFVIFGLQQNPESITPGLLQLAGIGSDAAELIQPVCAAVLGSTHWYGSSHKDVFCGVGVGSDSHVFTKCSNPLSSRHLSWQGLILLQWSPQTSNVSPPSVHRNEPSRH